MSATVASSASSGGAGYNAAALATQGIFTGQTFARQDELPQLPIPPLKDTCQRYLAALEPLQTPQQHKSTHQAVQSFCENDGPQLQERLHQYAEKRTSYIAEFWNEAYLQASESVVVNLNPFFILEDDPTPSGGSQLSRAANLTLAALAFIHDVRTGQLPPDDVRGIPLDMSQYACLFGGARIPTGTSQGCKMSVAPESKHMVVLRRGYAYWFHALDNEHRPLWTESPLVRTLQAICDDADARPPAAAEGAAVGILTANKRGRWHAQREKLVSDPHNEACLERIDSALFILCLDDDPPSKQDGSNENPARLAEAMLAGTYEIHQPNQDQNDLVGATPGVQVGSCTNRWWDKLQIIVSPSGGCGVNFEHTSLDGHTVLRFVADTYTELIMRFARSIHPRTKSLFNATLSPHARGAPNKRNSKASLGSSDVVYSLAPRALEWRWTPDMAAAVAHAEARLSDLVSANECEVLEFDGYGKMFITGHGFSPDAFVQMAMQAAYYSLFGRVVNTYEPAMTKQFRQGRTEAIRTVSPQSVEFCKTYVRHLPEPPKKDPFKAHPQAHKLHSARLDNGSLGEASSAQEVVMALRQACATHTRTSRLAAQGLGCDRHLYALHELWRRGLGANVPNAPPPDPKHLDEDTEGGIEMDLQYGTEPMVPEPSTTGSSSGSSQGPSSTEVPSIFADPGWTLLNTAVLSTSNCGNPALRLFGFGPTSPRGFGVGYIIKDRAIALCVSSRHRQTARFLAHVRTALVRMHAAVTAVYSAANTRRVATYMDASGHECDVRTGQPIRSDVPSSIPASGFSVRSLSFGTGSPEGHSTSWMGTSPLTTRTSVPSVDESEDEKGEHVGSTGYGFFDAGAPLPPANRKVLSPPVLSTVDWIDPMTGWPATSPTHPDPAVEHGTQQVGQRSRSPPYAVGRRLVFDDTSFP